MPKTPRPKRPKSRKAATDADTATVTDRDSIARAIAKGPKGKLKLHPETAKAHAEIIRELVASDGASMLVHGDRLASEPDAGAAQTGGRKRPSDRPVTRGRGHEDGSPEAHGPQRRGQQPKGREPSPPQPNGQNGYWTPEGYIPADSPRFPGCVAITKEVLAAFPEAERDTPWRRLCRKLAGPRLRLAAAFLASPPEEVRQLAREWSEARAQEVKETGGPGGRDGMRVEPTPERVEQWLLTVQQLAQTVLSEDCDDATLSRAGGQLQTCQSRFCLMSTARFSTRARGVHARGVLDAYLVSDYAMAAFLRYRLLLTIRDVRDRKLVRCTYCGRIEKARRKSQRLCAKCKDTPGVRQRVWRRRKAAPSTLAARSRAPVSPAPLSARPAS